MTDLALTIAPKSSQLNADDLISGPITITITKVSAAPSSADQPIAINFEGDEGRPFFPCKSMRRVLVQVWGRDGAAYRGRSMTLYRDPTVLFGGIQVGGIRISHMSGLDEPKTMALTATRASRKPYTVRPLEHAPSRFAFSLTNTAGKLIVLGADGEKWAKTACDWFAKADDETAAALWASNSAHVEAAEAAGHEVLASRVWTAASKRGLTETARQGGSAVEDASDVRAADASSLSSERGRTCGMNYPRPRPTN